MPKYKMILFICPYEKIQNDFENLKEALYDFVLNSYHISINSLSPGRSIRIFKNVPYGVTLG